MLSDPNYWNQTSDWSCSSMTLNYAENPSTRTWLGLKASWPDHPGSRREHNTPQKENLESVGIIPPNSDFYHWSGSHTSSTRISTRKSTGIDE